MKATMLFEAEVGPSGSQAAIEAWQDEKRRYADGDPAAKKCPLGMRKVGDVVDHPDCWRNCLMGQMKPADEECMNRVKAHFRSQGKEYTPELQADLMFKYAELTAMQITNDPATNAPVADEDDDE